MRESPLRRICTLGMATCKSGFSPNILDLRAHLSLFRRFRYTFTLKDAFLTSGISSLQVLDNRGWVAGSGANAFVSNHDTERVRPIDLSRRLCTIVDTSRRTANRSMHTHLQILTPWPLSSPCIDHHSYRFENWS